MDQPPGYHEATSSDPNTPHATDSKAPIEDRSSQYALMSFTWMDRIRLMRFPQRLQTCISGVLRTSWPKGIQDMRPYYDSQEIKLRGNPFAHGNDDEKLAIRKVILGILDVLAREGWGVISAGAFGRIGNYSQFLEKDSLIFQGQTPQNLNWICVSFDSRDLLHLINAPPTLARSMLNTFGDKVEQCNQDLVSGGFEIKFKGAPWSKATADGAVISRLLALDVLRCLNESGFTLNASLDLDGGQGGNVYSSSGETWFCSRPFGMG